MCQVYGYVSDCPSLAHGTGRINSGLRDTQKERKKGEEEEGRKRRKRWRQL